MSVDKAMAPKNLPNIVFVEGGLRAIKKYRRLLLRRIKWQPPQDGEPEQVQTEDSDSESEGD